MTGGETPTAALIIHAILRGKPDLDTIKRLATTAESCDARDGEGRLALHSAPYLRHLDVVRLLLDAGADIDGGTGTRH